MAFMRQAFSFNNYLQVGFIFQLAISVFDMLLAITSKTTPKLSNARPALLGMLLSDTSTGTSTSDTAIMRSTTVLWHNASALCLVAESLSFERKIARGI
jgi:hypothetical protein